MNCGTFTFYEKKKSFEYICFITLPRFTSDASKHMVAEGGYEGGITRNTEDCKEHLHCF